MSQLARMRLRWSTILGAAVPLALVSAPAFATTAIPIPEPSTLSLVAAGVAGVVIAIRARRRK
jgi:hypothetical protein